VAESGAKRSCAHCGNEIQDSEEIPDDNDGLDAKLGVRVSASTTHGEVIPIARYRPGQQATQRGPAGSVGVKSQKAEPGEPPRLYAGH
jgi:hypothetical protein